MPPRKVKKPKHGRTEEDLEAEREVQRLRERAESHLLQKEPPTPSASGTSRIPVTLRKSDGKDIVKRNASRKKKYLMVFPGAAALPPGARVGELTGLDTRTPILYIEFPPYGRMKLCGSLIFPKNGFISVKGPSSAKKPVQVVDSFETLVVFSEWAWIGDEFSNPGQVPQPLPAALRQAGLDLPELWKGPGKWKAVTKGNSGRASGASAKNDDEIILRDDSESPIDIVDDSDDEPSDPVDVDAADSDDWGGKGADIQVAPRAASNRKRKRVNYAQMIGDNDTSAASGEDEEAADDGQSPSATGLQQEGVGTPTVAQEAATAAARPRRKRNRISASQVSDDEYGVLDGAAEPTVSAARSRRRRKRITASQLSDDEYDIPDSVGDDPAQDQPFVIFDSD